MSRGGGRVVPGHVGFPRVSGDEPYQTVVIAKRIGFSPRERG